MYWSGRFWGVLKDMLRSYIMFLSACGARIILYFLYVLRFFLVDPRGHTPEIARCFTGGIACMWFVSYFFLVYIVK